MYACPLDSLLGWSLDPVAILVVLNFIIVVLVIILLALVSIPARIAGQFKGQCPDLFFNATNASPRNQAGKKDGVVRTGPHMQDSESCKNVSFLG